MFGKQTLPVDGEYAAHTVHTISNCCIISVNQFKQYVVANNKLNITHP